MHYHVMSLMYETILKLKSSELNLMEVDLMQKEICYQIVHITQLLKKSKDEP